MSNYRLIKASEWPDIRDNLPAAEFLWNPMIPARAKIITHSAPSVGKSAWSWGVMNAIQAGESYLGMPTKKAKCLLISNDMTEHMFKMRWDKNFVPRFDFIVIPKSDISSEAFHKSDAFKFIYSYVRENEIELVCIDTLGGLCMGKTMASDETATLLTGVINHWIGTDRSILILHHDKKMGRDSSGTKFYADKEDFLGSQMWSSDCTSQIHMWKSRDHQSCIKHVKSQVSALHEDTIKVYINLTGMAELWDDKRAQDVIQKFNAVVSANKLEGATSTEQVMAVMKVHQISERTAWRWYGMAHG